jgi:two-component system, response regulator FlrC
MHHQQTHLMEAPTTDGFVYGVSPTMQTVNEMAAEIARTDIPVLVVGESGTGKDAYARLIHQLSLNGELRLQKIDCATFDPAPVVSRPFARGKPMGRFTSIICKN